jgi:hypothetical protein
MAGWIKLHRKTLESQVFSDSELFRLWCYLLLRASFKTSWFRGAKIDRGQVAFSYRLLSDSLGYSRSKLERSMKKLEAMGNIYIKPGRDFSIATICNYESYQSDDESARDVDKSTSEADNEAADKTTSKAINEAVYKKETIPQVKNLSMVDGAEDDHAREDWTEGELSEARFAIQLLVRTLSANQQLKEGDLDLVIKAAVLSVRKFGSHWLQDALTGTKECVGRGNKFAYFHKCLSNSTEKLGCRFNQELARLDGKIPDQLLTCLDDAEAPAPRLCAVGEI